MPELTRNNLDDVAAACRAGTAETAAALQRALDVSVGLEVGQPDSLPSGALPEGLAGPGLVVVLMLGSTGVLFTLPTSTGLVPEWCAEPDPTGQSKLATLAQELGMLVLPEQWSPQDCKAGWVKDLAAALALGGVGEGGAIIPLELSVGGQPRGAANVIWRVLKPEAVLGTPSVQPAPAAVPEPRPAPPGGANGARATVPTPAVRRLPAYARSLLRIKVPVVVTLAEKRQPLGKIVEMSPGTILQFDKSCEEMLELAVGNHNIACGEAVKVGDKFGLRITSIVLPDEQFHPVKSKRASR